MIEFYTGMAFVLMAVALVGAFIYLIEYADYRPAYWRNKPPRSHYARQTLYWFGGVPAAWLWPVLLPLAAGYGILVLYRAGFTEEEE